MRSSKARELSSAIRGASVHRIRQRGRRHCPYRSAHPVQPVDLRRGPATPASGTHLAKAEAQALNYRKRRKAHRFLLPFDLHLRRKRESFHCSQSYRRSTRRCIPTHLSIHTRDTENPLATDHAFTLVKAVTFALKGYLAETSYNRSKRR